MTDASIDKQLERWVAGDPVHNDVRDECCPDFSCCQPDLLAPKDVRERFKAAIDAGDERAKMTMLGIFLGAALAKAAPDKNIYIAGEDAGNA